MKNRNIATILAPLIFLSACGGSDKSENSTSPTPDVAPKYQGVWVAPAYGSIIRIGEDSITRFQYTSDFCFIEGSAGNATTSDIEALVKSTDSPEKIEWYIGFGDQDLAAPGIVYTKTNALSSSCQNGIDLDITTRDFDAEETFAIFSQVFEEYYVDFERNNVNWQDIAYQASIDLNTQSDELALFSAMESTLEPLADSHNYIQSPSGYYAKTFTKPTQNVRLVEEYAALNDLPFPIPSELVTQQLVDEINEFVLAHKQNQWDITSSYAESEESITSRANGLVRWFESDGIGYLYIGGMVGYSTEEQGTVPIEVENFEESLEAALDAMQHVSGLVIDIRNNDGGLDTISIAAAGHFTDTEFHGYSKQAREGNNRTPLQDVMIKPRGQQRFTGDIVLLTSADTASAAEVFAMTMSQLPHVTVIGERSQGILSNVLEWELPNGFDIGLSNEFYLTPNGQWYEGEGIPVAIEVPFYSIEQRESESDWALETAAQLLLGQ